MTALAYHEPYKFTAALATLAIHAIFFAVLYLGVNWQVKPPEGMEVEIWDSLPQTENPPAQQPPVAQPAPPPKPQEMEKPVPPKKADIELAEKKKKPPVTQKPAPKPEPKKALSKAERRKLDEDIKALDQQQQKTDAQEQAARVAKAEQAAAAGAAVTSEIEKYKGLIRSRIRRKLVMPPDVADDALAEFEVTLLPSGELLDVKKVKSSGNAAYDSAVERAIAKAQPLPLPENESARKLFINPNPLRFKFSPKDRE